MLVEEVLMEGRGSPGGMRVESHALGRERESPVRVGTAGERKEKGRVSRGERTYLCCATLFLSRQWPFSVGLLQKKWPRT